MALSATLPDRETIDRAVNLTIEKGLKCQLCHAEKNENPVTVSVQPGTKGALIEAGFLVPDNK